MSGIGRRKIPAEMFKTGLLLQMLYTAWIPVVAVVLLLVWLFTRAIPAWLPVGVLVLWPTLAFVNQLRYCKRIVTEDSETEFGQLLDYSLDPEGEGDWRSRIKEDIDKKIRAACDEKESDSGDRDK